MELPKLYRVVYVELDWVTDRLVNGEHEQDEGEEWVKAMVILNSDNVKCWKVIDKDYLQARDGKYWRDIYPAEEGEPLNWSNIDPAFTEWRDKYKHHYGLSVERPTIKEQSEWAMAAKSFSLMFN